MREADFERFGQMLDAVCSLLSRGAYTPSPTNTALFFRALARYELADVRSAFDAHVADPQRGKFVPVPADLIAQLQSAAENDGRPGSEEAWAIAMRSADEAETVVWTQEIATAWGVARSVLAAGDEVGARMAFREAYTRIVSEARAQRKPMAWTASIGFDPDRRDVALQQAAELGRIDAPQLMAPDRGSMPLLTLAQSEGIPPEAREKLLALRDRLTKAADEPSADAQAKSETALRQEETARRVAEYEARRTA